MNALDDLDFRLLNDWQHDFPLCSTPYRCIGARLGVDEFEILDACERLKAAGRIARIGAVFAPRRVGASTLAALRVPPWRLAEVAAAVSAFPGVNHNYEREHDYNLWFVVTAASADKLAATLAAIETSCGLPVLRLPLEAEYHIDLGFALDRLHGKTAAASGPERPTSPFAGRPSVRSLGGCTAAGPRDSGHPKAGDARGASGDATAVDDSPSRRSPPASGLQMAAEASFPPPHRWQREEETSSPPVPLHQRREGGSVRLDAGGQALVGALQDGLPFCSRPYASVARRLGLPEATLLTRIGAWLDSGVLKRFGVVVRHRELGYTANAMLVHDIPDALVDELGRRLGDEAAVTLCYRRPRVPPAWRYNLFCMIHGRQRDAVEAAIADLRRRHGLEAFPHAVLFSRTRYKQQGARYVEPQTEPVGA